MFLFLFLLLNIVLLKFVRSKFVMLFVCIDLYNSTIHAYSYKYPFSYYFEEEEEEEE